MKAISTVLAVILVVIIVVALVGLTYSFSIALFGVTTEVGEKATEKIATGLMSQARVEFMSLNDVTIRNIGLTDLSNFIVFINGEQADFIADPLVIEPERIGTITITDFIKEGDEIKILASEGASVTKKAPDPCKEAVLCLNFDEGSGTKAKDSSPYHNDGTLLPIGSEPQWVEGKYGSALSFDGIDDYIEISHSSSLNMLENKITISVWINFTSTNNFRSIVDKSRHTGNQEYNLGKRGIDTMGFYISNGTFEDFIETSVLNNNTWYHIVAIFDNGDFKIYVNGILNVSKTSSSVTTIAQKTGSLWIGSDNRIFDGIIDEVRIYNKAIY